MLAARGDTKELALFFSLNQHIIVYYSACLAGEFYELYVNTHGNTGGNYTLVSFPFLYFSSFYFCGW
jgi:hypothetical protein